MLRSLLGRPRRHEDVGGMLRKAVMVCQTVGSGQPLTDADLPVLRLSFARVRDSAWQRSISLSLVLFIFRQPLTWLPPQLRHYLFLCRFMDAPLLFSIAYVFSTTLLCYLPSLGVDVGAEYGEPAPSQGGGHH